jgi:multidrug resistance efflux pump
VYRGDKRVEHSPIQECIDALRQRLAAAEAQADHVSFEHEVDTQQLEARLAAAEAESRRLLSLIGDTAKALLAGCEGIPWVVAIDAAMVAAVAEIRQLRTKLAAAEARSLDPTVAQQKLLDELAAARAEIVRLKTISVAQLVREAELSKNPGELEPRHLED